MTDDLEALRQQRRGGASGPDRSPASRRRGLATVVLLAAFSPATAAAGIDVAVIGSSAMRDALDEDARTTPRDLSVAEAEAFGFGAAELVVAGNLLPDGPSQQLLARVSDFLVEGGGLLLFWDGAALLLDGFDDAYRFGPSRQLGWYTGVVGAGVNLVERSPISLQESDHQIRQLVGDLPETIDWGAAAQFFLTVEAPDPLLAVVASYQGDGSDAFPEMPFPALLAGRACSGRVVLMPINIHDAVGDSPDLARLVREAAWWAIQSPRSSRGPCPPAPDLDGDGVDVPGDNCPNSPNRGQADTDGDGLGDRCDLCPIDPGDDADEDGYCANEDNCPEMSNEDQADGDGDAVGDACDACPGRPGTDEDGDGLCTSQDNCPQVPNPGQEDADGDGLGDVCDLDRDGDGLDNAAEEAAGADPDDADSDDDGVLDGEEPDWSGDHDGDGLIQARDPDSDNDGLPDGLELGVRVPTPATNRAAGHFIPDADPTTTTSPLVADTDRGGVADGAEDIIPNGRVDPGEGDPNDPFDDRSLVPTDAGPRPDAAGDASAPDADAGLGFADARQRDVPDASGGDAVHRDGPQDGRDVPLQVDSGGGRRCPACVTPDCERGQGDASDGCSCAIRPSRPMSGKGLAPVVACLLLAWRRRGSLQRRRPHPAPDDASGQTPSRAWNAEK